MRGTPPLGFGQLARQPVQLRPATEKAANVEVKVSKLHLQQRSTLLTNLFREPQEVLVIGKVLGDIHMDDQLIKVTQKLFGGLANRQPE